jgi:two-component system, chemotaxis family, protein-glutamate methylesterase/glutaminase
MPGHDIIVIGGSAGGVEALVRLVRGLPPDLPAAVFVVIHFPESVESMLPRILSRAGDLPASHARDGEAIGPGRIYVARPGCHLHVERGRLRLTRGPKENNHRPAVDPLFRSAAWAYGPRVIGVILSGTLDDGTAGLAAIKRHGGLAVVQDPEDALYAGMPRSAAEHNAVDHVVPLADLPGLLSTLARQPVSPEALQMPDQSDRDAVEMTAAENHQPAPGSEPSVYSCPECSGTLFEVQDGELVRFRCRVGHAYGSETLLASQGEALEAALWTALRALEEHASLSRRMAQSAGRRGNARSASTFTEQALGAEHHASVIRGVLERARSGEDLAELADAASSLPS